MTPILVREIIVEKNIQEMYSLVFTDYPDVLDVQQVSCLLGVSTKTVYRLLKEDLLASIKVGREFRIPKYEVMRYLNIIATEEPTP